MNTRALLLLSLMTLASRQASAIGVDLEENRAERGNIGYIDMQRLFKAYPETIRAKENFEEVVRQAEEQLNVKKAELLRLRNDLSQLKIERDFIAKTPYVVPASTAAAPPPASSTGTAAQTTAPAPAVSTGTAKTAVPAPVLLISTSNAPSPLVNKQEPLVINIPGVSTGPAVVMPPSAPALSTSTTAVATTPPLAVPSTGTAATTFPPLASTWLRPAPATNPALAELDMKIAGKARDLAQKEADFKQLQASTEKNLLDLESRRTEILLGKIHKAVQEVARKEGVSVVVDKSSIVFGHDAVDLTEKVLKYLKAP